MDEQLICQTRGGPAAGRRDDRPPPAGPAPAQQASGAPPGAPATAPAARTVTLVTGDRVTVTGLGGGRRTVTVERPEGATGAVRTRAVNGRISVVPDEALPYLRAGQLDRRLFDVDRLLDQQLADADSGELPLVVTYYGRADRHAPGHPADPDAAQCARGGRRGGQGARPVARADRAGRDRRGVAGRAGHRRDGRVQRPDRHS
ncbi:hypothetical protein SFUMM280S_04835 [Streptomyces fumanus]